MPSLHVAIAVLVALFVRESLPRLQWVAWTFAALTFVGSIHLGWHYASDGVISAIAVVVIWLAVGRYVSWLSTLSIEAFRSDC